MTIKAEVTIHAYNVAMRPITQVRFNALAGYCRESAALYMAEELAWFEHAVERVLGLVIKDKQDEDFAGMVLARDRKGRFRWVGSTSFEPSKRRAKVLLRREMERISMQPDEEYYQGDETGAPLDFFSLKKPREQINSDFLILAEEECYSSARGIIEPMMHWYEDLDGNFIEQFQTTGFNARIWELYLFATFREMGYKIDNIHAIPDFNCVGAMGEFKVEATTVNPTLENGVIVPPPPRKTENEFNQYLREYMPIKYGSALISKLAKKYWEKPNVLGKPLLFAIQDFSSPELRVPVSSSLENYLYGYNHDYKHDDGGRLIITPRKIDVHQWGNKEIPSGFFDLPDAKYVSAVIFNSSATISKFNRMGKLAGFGSNRVHMIRKGTAYNHEENAAEPKIFVFDLSSPDYSETWVEGLNVYHNPNAIYPVYPPMFPGAAHHRLLPNGQIDSLIPDWHPLGSITLTLTNREQTNLQGDNNENTKS